MLCLRGVDPAPVAALAALAVSGQRARLERLKLPGLELYETARNGEGLFSLRRLGPQAAPGAPELAGEFWRRVFLWRLAGEPQEPARQAWEALAAAWPKLAVRLRASLPELSRVVARLGREGPVDPAARQAGLPPFWSLPASFLEMSGLNADASPAWARQGLEFVEALAELTA